MFHQLNVPSDVERKGSTDYNGIYFIPALFLLLLCINMSSRRHRKGRIGAISFH